MKPDRNPGNNPHITHFVPPPQGVDTVASVGAADAGFDEETLRMKQKAFITKR